MALKTAAAPGGSQIVLVPLQPPRESCALCNQPLRSAAHDSRTSRIILILCLSPALIAIRGKVRAEYRQAKVHFSLLGLSLMPWLIQREIHYTGEQGPLIAPSGKPNGPNRLQLLVRSLAPAPASASPSHELNHPAHQPAIPPPTWRENGEDPGQVKEPRATASVQGFPGLAMARIP